MLFGFFMGVRHGDFVDRTGMQHPNIRDAVTPGFPMMRRATIDVDRTWVHWDYNSEKVKLLMKEHPEVAMEVKGPPFYLLKSTSNTTAIRPLLKQYKIETNREYITRSRQGLNRMRQLPS